MIAKMKSIKGLKGLALFVGVMWAVVVVTYAAQVRLDANGDGPKFIKMTEGTSCSSTTTTTSE